MGEHAIWFESERARLFGWVHTPASDEQIGAVVLCPGLGRDGANAHYTYRRLAIRLAEAGLMAIRFDYDGTGDSLGDGLGGNRVEAWLASIEAAVTLARDEGATSVSLVGLRMGALLAEHAAERIPDVDALVLWDPSVSGRAFVRSQRALEAFRPDSGGGPVNHHGIPWLAMSADGLAELSSLTAPEEAHRAPTATLLLHRPGDTSVDRVRARLGDQPVDSVEIDGQYELLDLDSAYNVVPEQTIAKIVKWLRTTLLAADPDRPTTPNPGPLAIRLGASADHMLLESESSLGSVRESVMSLGPANLFGIETVAERPNPRLPTVVFLNSGRISHVSPGRVWVRVARRLATLGFRCVRFDLSGIGDSSTRPGQTDQTPCAPAAFDDIEEAVRAISPDDPGNIVFIGLSSGGYHALELGLKLTPRAVCPVNPIISFTPTEFKKTGRVDPRRRVCIPKSTLTVRVSKRVKSELLHRGLVRLARLIRHLRYIISKRLETDLLHRVRVRLARMFGHFRLPRPSQTAQNPPQTVWLRELVNSGVNVYGICAPPEALDMLGDAEQLPADLTATGRCRVDVIDGLHHSLIPLDHQELVSDLLAAYLTEEFLTDGDDAHLVVTDKAG